MKIDVFEYIVSILDLSINYGPHYLIIKKHKCFKISEHIYSIKY